MALTGGGGAGNVVGGANPSGTGSNLNYIGDHAHALSGVVQPTNGANATAFEFTTGNSYLVGNYTFNINMADLSTNTNIGYLMYFDDQLVISSVAHTSASYSPGDIDIPVPIIIPPFTKVKVEAYTTQGGTVDTFHTITGRVYA